MMSNYLNDLEKIANQVLTEQEMNPDPQPELTEEDVQEAQTGQSPPVEGLSEEEAALKQQLDEEILMAEEQEEIERAEQHDMVDRALLEGAAEQAVAEMTDEEIKDILIEKAASDLLGLGALSKLVDIATEEYDGHVKQAATQTLEYMSISNENFVNGLNKVAEELFEDDDNIDELFSRNGVDYVFEQLAKLSDYNSLSKVASDEDVEALAVIVENESDKINAAKDIVTEAYEEAIKEIAKEDIKDSIMESGEYDEQFLEESLEQTAGFSPKSVAKGVGLFGTGVGTGISGTLLYQQLRNGEISPDDLTDEEIEAVNQVIHEQEETFEQTASSEDIDAVALHEAVKNGEVSIEDLTDVELEAIKEIDEKVSMEEDTDQNTLEQVANFYNELGMYKEAKGIRKKVSGAREYAKQTRDKKKINKDMESLKKRVSKGKVNPTDANQKAKELSMKRSDARKALKNNTKGAQDHRDLRNAGLAVGTAGVAGAGGYAGGKAIAGRNNSDEMMIQTANFYNELGMYKQANPLVSAAGKGLGKAKNLFGKVKSNAKGAFDYSKSKSNFNKANQELGALSQKGKVNMKDPSRKVNNLRQTKRDSIQGMRDNKQAYQNTMKAGVVGAAGLGATNAVYNAGKTKGQNEAQNMPQMQPQTAGMYQMAGEEYFYGMEKKASIVNKTKKVIDRVFDATKNVKKNKESLKLREDDLNRFVENNTRYGPSDPGQLTKITDDLHRLEKDIMLGSAIRYGVPATGITAGSIIAGKKLSDAKKKKALEEEVEGSLVDPIHKTAAVGALMPAWKGIKEFGGNSFKKVSENLSSVDKVGDIGTSLDGINTDFTANNSDPRLGKYFKQYQDTSTFNNHI